MSDRTAASDPIPDAAGSTELTGEVRDVVYENADSGYAVLRLWVAGTPGLVTVTGSLYGLQIGARVTVVGEFREHPRFGRQLQAGRHEELAPRSRAGMIAFLSSQFRGIGQRLAQRVVDTFGDDTYAVLDAEPRRIGEVPGVGKQKAIAIAKQWQERKGIREAATFLHGYGVGPGQVVRVFRHYGDATVALVRSNPFRLADEVRGIGFRTADRIAQNLGIPKAAPERARAAIGYLLNEAAGQGHLLLPREELVRRAAALEIGEEAARQAIELLAADREVVVEDGPPGGVAAPVAPGAPWDRTGAAVSLMANWNHERATATMLLALAAEDPYFQDPRARVAAAARQAGLDLAPEQEDALVRSLSHRLAVITGGPGVGKTTIVRLLVDLLESRDGTVCLAAPTGRAAKRLSEATGGRPASTIHRLLGFDPFANRFVHDENDPLELDHLVVDECSMLDVPLASALLRAIPEGARVTLVGDADQLPSVGPGDFFRAVCASAAVPVTRLARVFRQREGSRIVEGAHAVNRGELPAFDPPGPGGEFYFVARDDAGAVADMIRTLVAERIPEAYGLDPRHDVQTLTPMHKGLAGAENLNAVLGQALNPNPPGRLTRRERTFAPGDRIVQIRNDYEKSVFNGDQGFIVAVDEKAGTVTARIDERDVEYEGDDLGMLLPAWATTVHRAQGGEHKAVVLALTGQHFPLLRRNLVYTAITRARQLCVIVGSRQALERAIRNDATQDRCSWLEERLRASATDG